MTGPGWLVASEAREGVRSPGYFCVCPGARRRGVAMRRLSQRWFRARGRGKQLAERAGIRFHFDVLLCRTETRRKASQRGETWR